MILVTGGAGYIASDADYVDYITELMGGFSIPPEVKELRKGKQYLLIGLRLNRDTERMVMADIIYAAHTPPGWVLIAEPTATSKAPIGRFQLNGSPKTSQPIISETKSVG